MVALDSCNHSGVPSLYLAMKILCSEIILQVTLGITTLMTYVPASLGSAHQAGALTLFSVVLALMHSLRKDPSQLLKPRSFLRQYSMPMATGAVLAVAAAVTLEK